MRTVIILDWEDMNGKKHQEEFCFPGRYDGGARSWVHEWSNPEDGLRKFLSHCPLHNIRVRTFAEQEHRELRTRYIVIPENVLPSQPIYTR